MMPQRWTLQRLQSVHLIILQDMTLADSMPNEGDLLIALLVAVAFGATLISLHAWQRTTDPFTSEKCVRHVPSREAVDVSVVVTETFAERHRRCTQLLEAAASGPRSRWKVRTVGDIVEDKKAFRVHTMSDLASFIRRVRRISNASGVMAGTLFSSSSQQRVSASQQTAPTGKESQSSSKGSTRPRAESERRPSLRELF